jgi:hypothetical protein
VRLNDNDLKQLNEEKLASLARKELLSLSARLLADLKELHDRLNQTSNNSSHLSGSMEPWKKTDKDEANAEEVESQAESLPESQTDATPEQETRLQPPPKKKPRLHPRYPPKQANKQGRKVLVTPRCMSPTAPRYIVQKNASYATSNWRTCPPAPTRHGMNLK